MFKKKQKELTTIWSTGWVDKLNEVIEWANKHDEDHEKAIDPVKLLLRIKALEARIEALERKHA